MIDLSFRQNLRPYPSLTHAPGEFLTQTVQNDFGVSRSGCMGRKFCRIIAFTKFSVFSYYVGFQCSGFIFFMSSDGLQVYTVTGQSYTLIFGQPWGFMCCAFVLIFCFCLYFHV